MKSIRKRAIIKSLGDSYGLNLKYKKSKYNCYVVEASSLLKDSFVIKEDVRVLRWSNVYPRIKQVVRANHASRVWIKEMSKGGK